VLRLTRTGKIFLAVIVAMQLASITSQSGLLIWVVGLISGCIAVNGIAAYRSVHRVKLKAPPRILVEEGMAPRDPWQLTNQGKRRARLITVECNDRVWLKAPEIAPGQTVAAVPRDVFKARGVYALGEAWVVSLFPFGLIKAMVDSQTESEVLVYPKLVEVEAPEVRGLDPMIGGRHTGQGRVAAGANFAGVRPMQDGDSFKQIHWKSSAKGTGLMVKMYEEELAGRAALLVFCEKGSAHTEGCLRHAGSLAVAGLAAGHQIDWRNLNEERRILLPPFGDTGVLLEELARFNSGAGNLNGAALEELVHSIRARVAIHFVATSFTPLIEKQVNELISRERMVVVHLPRGRAPKVDCAVRHFEEA
jgi:uncharacterized protein (DUF58 family)